MTDEVVHISDLTPDPENRRQHTPRNMGMIVDSLQELGAGRSVLIDEDGLLIAGNGVIEGAGEAGIEKVRIVDSDGDEIIAVRRKNLTEEQKRKMALFDNRTAELAEWDTGQLQADLEQGLDFSGIFEKQELSNLLDAELDRSGTGQKDPNAIPASPMTPKTRPGDVIELGPHRIMCGDAQRSTRELCDPESVSLVVTSFPYALGVDYGPSYQDDIVALRHLLTVMPPIIHEVLVPGGYCMTNFMDIVVGKEIVGTDEVCEYPMALEYWPAFRAADFTLHTRRIWAKTHGSVHAPWTAGSNRAASDWEHLWTWKKAGSGLNERRDPSYRGIWDTPPSDGLDLVQQQHPATFLVSVPERAITVYTNRGGLVLDPFLGTGTTIMACEITGRVGYGIELSPEYCDMAARRWEEFTGNEAVWRREE